TPLAPRTAVFPLPNTSHAKPNRGPYSMYFRLSYSPDFLPEMPPVNMPSLTLPLPGTMVPAHACENVLLGPGAPRSGLYEKRLAVAQVALPATPVEQYGK